MLTIRLIVHALALYGLLVAVVYVLQGWLIFPRYAVRFDKLDILSANEDVLHIKTPNGLQLEGLIVTATKHPTQDTLIVFGGNAYDTPSLVRLLKHVYKDLNIVGFNYRGYGGSQGTPGEEVLFSDSLLIYDEIRTKFPKGNIHAFGVSIGASVATYMAAQKKVSGLILVTPFDSVLNVAKGYYPFLPVKSLLKHPMETTKFMPQVTTPVAIISAEKDKIVKNRHTKNLKQTVPNMVYEAEIANTGHNDIFMKSETIDALRKALTKINSSGNSDQ